MSGVKGQCAAIESDTVTVSAQRSGLEVRLDCY